MVTIHFCVCDSSTICMCYLLNFDSHHILVTVANTSLPYRHTLFTPPGPQHVPLASVIPSHWQWTLLSFVQSSHHSHGYFDLWQDCWSTGLPRQLTKAEGKTPGETSPPWDRNTAIDVHVSWCVDAVVHVYCVLSCDHCHMNTFYTRTQPYTYTPRTCTQVLSKYLYTNTHN